MKGLRIAEGFQQGIDFRIFSMMVLSTTLLLFLALI